ncbi:DUF4189 domain-containing protein [Nocardia asteroides]|uniref:DUF4189 domain-containing protein n=1 Tax=Nocardia asteroides NBRC 15531 TaxID=1110697 RepID=U5E6X6_NOCAS|nr:DUF4189 domain-containing protein [Nocardia asteroides]GAD82076.1 hypothetical protein NCAST_05_05140 [Nocardia asteroides NBRC 15531]SFN11753.1 protein of unknown function [Nocardia asteroides]VEG36869.1 Uncharacterised protein [Nocardia asteroides]
MKRLLTSAAVFGATTAALFAGHIAPANAQASYYGAIAASVRAGVYGYATDYGSYADAEAGAMAACRRGGGGGGCDVKVSYRNGCGAIAISRGWWSYGNAATIGGAKREALNSNPGNASIKHWNCTSGYQL